MINIPLQAIANQDLSIQLDNLRYVITIKETNGVMSASVSRDNVELVSMNRITAFEPLLPTRYDLDGNFVFLTQNDELPEYVQFGVTQFLVYVSAAEIAALEGA
jgi:hypothetical protein